MRTGLIGQKMGMSRVFTEDGQHVPVTVVNVGGCQVVGQRTKEKDGYSALCLGFGTTKAKNVSKPLKGQFKKAKVEARKKIAEFRVSDEAMVDVGAEISASHFVEGQFVDVVGTSIGKGFAGAMKRHNFHGLRATHGVSISHRAHGSTGQRQDPGRVFKGKKMAGHYGDAQITVQNLEVVKTLPDEGLILIKGAVPGAEGGYLLISDAVKKALPKNAPLPAALKGGEGPAEETPAETPAEETKPETPAETAKAETAAETPGAEDKAEEAKTGEAKGEEKLAEAKTDAPAEKAKKEEPKEEEKKPEENNKEASDQ